MRRRSFLQGALSLALGVSLDLRASLMPEPGYVAVHRRLWWRLVRTEEPETWLFVPCVAQPAISQRSSSDSVPN